MLQDGQRIDECALPTKRSCSCVPSWVSNGKTYTGCSEINSPGKPWCKVREKGCGDVNGIILSFYLRRPLPAPPLPLPPVLFWWSPCKGRGRS